VLGFVAVASAEAPGSRSAGISLITATATSVVLALLGIPWILERSLQPMREQINRLRQFAGDVAHELRNPLMALKTTVANTRVHLPQQAREPVQMSLTSLDTISTRMATILDDVLLLARIENGTDDTRETTAIVDMAELFDELSVLHDSEARARSVNLRFTIDGPLPISVIPTRVQRILSNLISNIGDQQAFARMARKLIADLDRPGEGFINVSQDAMLELRAWMDRKER
jgi:signal transduction histidine kinase